MTPDAVRPAQTQSVHLQLPADLLARLDQARGDVPRNAWLRRAIQQRLERETTPMTPGQRAKARARRR